MAEKFPLGIAGSSYVLMLAVHLREVTILRWTKRWTCLAEQQPGKDRQELHAT